MRGGIFVVVILLCFSFIKAEKPIKQRKPVVNILNPIGGQTSKRSLQVNGTISDPQIKRAIIIINGSANEFDVQNGRFSYFVVLAPGENLIQIVAENAFGVGRDNVCLFASVPKRDVKIVMTWDTATDIDLHVIDPTGEECYYQKRKTKSGGMLDKDDTDGFGPETFLMSNAIFGKYIVKVKYYGGKKGQTRVAIQSVLFEGTAKEQRKTYYRLLTKSGEFSEVCSFFVQK